MGRKNFQASPQPNPIWWKGNDPVTIDDRSSDLPYANNTYDDFSFQSSIQLASSPASLDVSATHPDKVFVVPVQGSETPTTRAKLPGLSPGSRTPEIERKLSKAHPENVQNVALEMYRLLRQNGLDSEANKAFNQMDRRDSRSLPAEATVLGMDYILRDGIVNYLRDVATLSPPIPRQVVKFSNINLSVMQEQQNLGFYDTFGNKLLACFLGPLFNILLKRKTTSKLTVLKDIHGYIMPGTTTLLLGPPGSGKSSLLKVLAGRQVSDKKNTKLEGSVLYNDRSASEMLLTRLIAYINSQTNKHLPFLTVRETLVFAEECTQLGMRPENFTPQMKSYFAQALVQGQDPYLEYIIHVLGLKDVQHKLISSLSDSDRNRLSIAEIAMGTYSVMLYDEPCHGHDPVATYDLVFTLRAIARIQQCSSVMSLVQVTPEVFELFDRVLLLSQGEIIYQGPRQDVLEFFSQFGYQKPSHVDAAAFLQDIAAGEGNQYIPLNNHSPTVDQLIARYKASDVYKDILRVVSSGDIAYTLWVESEPNIGLSVRINSTEQTTEVVVARLSKSDRTHDQCIESTGCIKEEDIVTGISTNGGAMHYIAIGSEKDQRTQAAAMIKMLKNARGHLRLQVERRTEEEEEDQHQFQKQYLQSWSQSTKSLVRRHLKVTMRLKIVIILRLMQVLILGSFGGCIFYKMGGTQDQADMNIVRAIGFVSTFTIMLINVVQLPIHFIQRPVFYKHRAQRFFRVSSYLAAQAILNAPQSFVEAFLYSITVYFISNLSMERAGLHYFQFLCLLFLVAYMGSFLVILLSAIAPIVEAGNALAGLMVSLALLFSGFIIFPSLTPRYWKWMMSVNPLRWGNLVFCMAEFPDRYKKACKDEQYLFCLLNPNLTVGKAFLKFNQLDTETRWLFVAYAVIAGASLILCFASHLALTKISFPEISPSLPVAAQGKQSLNYHLEDAELEDSISWTGLSKITDAAVTKVKWIKDDDIEGQQDQDEDQSQDENQEGLGWKHGHIPVKPITLAFHNLSFSYHQTAAEEVVLDRVSGYAKPGTMLAIMGSRKSGKSTLLQCLAGRAPTGQIKGEILANGFKLDSNTLCRVSGFVEKLDAHQPFLTVKESLEFSAALRLGDESSHGVRKLQVELVLELMGLSKVKDQLVGSLKYATGKTFELSKKLTIAVELAANPSMLFLEDPTSDLDSVAIRSILHSVQLVAASGRTVVCTTQNASARVLSAFNNIVILRPGGEQVYFGPVGWNCSQVLEYFTSIPPVPQYDPNSNPVTFLLDILGAGIHKKQPAHNFGLVYRASQLGIQSTEELKHLRKKYKKNSLKSATSLFAASYWRQAWMVFLRTQRFLWRNVQYTFGRLTGCLALGLLLGSVYVHSEAQDTFSLTSRSLFIYIQVMLIGVVTANNVVPQLSSDRLAYYREQRAAMYAPIFYPVSWALAEIPYLFVATFAFVGIANGMAGIATDTLTHFIAYWFCFFIFTTTVMYFGMFIAIATPVPVLAAFIVSITTSIWVSAAGIIVPKSKILNAFQWLYWANPFQYATHALTSISFFCDTKSSACLACTVGHPCAGCSCPRLLNIENATKSSTPIFMWDRLRQLRSLDEDRVSFDLMALAAMSLLFALLAFASFIFFKHNKPPK